MHFTFVALWNGRLTLCFQQRSSHLSIGISAGPQINPECELMSKCRNFRSRNDGNKDTMNFLASPTIVTAMTFSGKLSFNPVTDTIETPSGTQFKFSAPLGQDLPGQGFARGDLSLYPPPNPVPRPETEIVISPTSTRLEILKPFKSHFGTHNPRGLELPALKVLMRVRGKCTTDHISAAV